MQAGFKSGFFMAKKLLLFLIFFFLFPFSVWAASVGVPTNLPTEMIINQAFSLNGEISGWQSGQVYFVKCRIGFSSSSLTEGQTYNANTNSWLSDGGAWVEMPTTENTNFSLQCKLKSGVEPGNKIVFLRACLKQADGGCLSSSSFQSASGVNLMVLAEPTPTPTPSPVPNPTPTLKPATPTPKPTATYKINEVKDGDGEVLNIVKVYVDGVYLHHYAPEVLTFCDGCQCDTYVSCGFGQHVIKLEKTGYHDWSETKTFNFDSFYEVNPVMTFLESTPTPTSSPTSTPKQTVTPSLTPKPTSKTASESGEVLGEEVATLSAFYPYEATEGAGENKATSSAKNKLWPKVFLVVGLLLVFASAFWGWYNLKDYTS